jgi:hypothetical protein
MSQFPLYENLIKNVSQDDLTFDHKEEFIKLCKTVDTSGAELIYALIRTYQLENCEDKSTFKLPYGGKFVKSDMKFDLNDLPNELKHVLYNFIIIHNKKIIEEKQIEKTRLEDVIDEKKEIKETKAKSRVKKKF